ncbi:hypothetical protein IE53DRAFT_154434 [Violaceomyces palustris]|uniref:Uncharacterized protein n=1 Tax=Violaceomyces palustris TaxID=1673888 RepID=A0ACD0NU08_9BASI|nr:hypothetical protein IE53DRAFT_154434 [Violaceomyces palustris]
MPPASHPNRFVSVTSFPTFKKRALDLCHLRPRPFESRKRERERERERREMNNPPPPPPPPFPIPNSFPIKKMDRPWMMRRNGFILFFKKKKNNGGVQDVFLQPSRQGSGTFDSWFFFWEGMDVPPSRVLRWREREGLERTRGGKKKKKNKKKRKEKRDWRTEGWMEDSSRIASPNLWDCGFIGRGQRGTVLDGPL